MVKRKEEERRINPMPKRRRLALMDGPGVDSASASLSAPPSATSYRSASIVHSFIHSFVGSWAPSRHSTRRRRRQSQQGNAGGIFLVFFFFLVAVVVVKGNSFRWNLFHRSFIRRRGSRDARRFITRFHDSTRFNHYFFFNLFNDSASKVGGSTAGWNRPKNFPLTSTEKGWKGHFFSREQLSNRSSFKYRLAGAVRR